MRLARHGPRRGRVFFKRVVNAVRAIIKDVIPDQTAQMNVIEDNHAIEKLSATASDPAFRDSILPRTRKACSFGLQAAGIEQIGDIFAVLAITIQNYVAIRRGLRKCLPELLHDPRACRVFRDVEMEDLPSAVFDDEETVENSEVEGRHGEEVHGRDNFAVIAQKSIPELACIRSRRNAPEIAGYRTFRDVEAEFQKLSMNSRSTPRGILVRHAADEGSNLGIELWPARALCTRSKAPEQTKASTMPGDDSLWLNNNQGIAPRRSEPTEQNPKYAILDLQSRARIFSLEHAQLLAESKDL